MVNTMGATKQSCPLHNKKALLSQLQFLDRTLMAHPETTLGTHDLPIAVGGSLASTVPRSVFPLLPDK